MHIDRELYFTVDQSNELSNHSGCGNDINHYSGATKKIILDSLVHWVEKFDIDGFRFDLAELIDVELLEEIEITQKNKAQYNTNCGALELSRKNTNKN